MAQLKNLVPMCKLTKKEKSKKENETYWSELPSSALEKIYLLLGRKDDQVRMSLVCRNWFQGYSSPRVWRKIRFELREPKYPSANCREVYFARKYGNMFHHVEIVCYGSGYKNCNYSRLGVICQQLKLFLSALTFHSLNFSRIKSLSFIGMKYFRFLNNINYRDIFQRILNIFLAQKKLISVEFRDCEFERSDASRLLKIICMQNFDTLKVLKLRGFDRESAYDDFLENEVDVCITNKILINLQEVVVDYSKFFETIIMEYSKLDNDASYQQRKGSLEKMEIICHDFKTVNYRRIKPDVWKDLTKKCPRLKIKLSFKAGGSQTEVTLDTVLVKYMPIQSLTFIGSHMQSGNSIENEFGSFFRYLRSCKVNLFLEELNIFWSQNSTHFEENFIHFLAACSKLKDLELRIQHPVLELGTVFDFWLQNRPMSLSNFSLTIEGVDESDYWTYLLPVNEFESSLEEIGLSLTLGKEEENLFIQIDSSQDMQN